jgi:hypothetical protein
MKPTAKWNQLTTRQQRRYAIKLQNNSAAKVSMAEALKLAQKIYDGETL